MSSSKKPTKKSTTTAAPKKAATAPKRIVSKQTRTVPVADDDYFSECEARSVDSNTSLGSLREFLADDEEEDTRTTNDDDVVDTTNIIRTGTKRTRRAPNVYMDDNLAKLMLEDVPPAEYHAVFGEIDDVDGIGDESEECEYVDSSGESDGSESGGEGGCD